MFDIMYKRWGHGANLCLTLCTKGGDMGGNLCLTLCIKDGDMGPICV